MPEPTTLIIPDTYLIELDLAMNYCIDHSIDPDLDPDEQDFPDNGQDFDEDASNYYIDL